MGHLHDKDLGNVLVGSKSKSDHERTVTLSAGLLDSTITNNIQTKLGCIILHLRHKNNDYMGVL